MTRKYHADGKVYEFSDDGDSPWSQPANADVDKSEKLSAESNGAPSELEEYDPRTQPAPCCGSAIGGCNVAPLPGELTHCIKCGELLVYGEYGWQPSR